MATISEVFSQIANSIRNKLGTTIGYKPEQMPAAIDSIPQEVIGDDTSDATATAADIASGKTAYAKSVKLTGTNTKDSNTQDATATASDILSGKTAYAKGSKITGTSSAVVPSGNVNLGTFTENGSKTNLDVSGKATASFTVDVPSSGTDTSDATVTSNSQILSGYSAYSNGTKFTGSMTNRGAVSASVGMNGTYYIPQGFHNGNGIVSGPSVSQRTASSETISDPKTYYSGYYPSSWTVTPSGTDTSDATATEDDLVYPKTAYVNGIKITGKIGAPKSFSTATDEEITEMLTNLRNGKITHSDLHNAGWIVGAERPVHLSAVINTVTGTAENINEQDATLVILDDSHYTDIYNNYYLVDGGRSNYAIGLKNCLLEVGYMDGDGETVSYDDSRRKRWCDEIFIKCLPEEVRKWFKEFYYYTATGNGDSTLIRSQGYFTIPSASEIFGKGSDLAQSVVYAEELNSSNSSQLVYFGSSRTENRIKYLGDSSTTPTMYWLRSPDKNYNRQFACVAIANDKTGCATYWQYQRLGLCPFGCV